MYVVTANILNTWDLFLKLKFFTCLMTLLTIYCGRMKTKIHSATPPPILALCPFSLQSSLISLVYIQHLLHGRK